MNTRDTNILQGELLAQYFDPSPTTKSKSQPELSTLLVEAKKEPRANLTKQIKPDTRFEKVDKKLMNIIQDDWKATN